jgi:hypothetical protein
MHCTNALIALCYNVIVLGLIVKVIVAYYFYRSPVLMSMLLFWQPACLRRQFNNDCNIYFVCVGLANKLAYVCRPIYFAVLFLSFKYIHEQQ